MKIVLRIGGSVLDSPPNVELLKEYAPVVTKIRRLGHSVGVVVGGGPVSRLYIDAARRLELSHKYQDLIAIQASRLNARLVAMKFGVSTVHTTIRGAIGELDSERIAVMGGLRPGITTDTVAALLGISWGADMLVKGSDQKGIYTADPRTDKTAKLLRSMSHKDLSKILVGKHKPGIHSIVDPVAVKYITKHKLKLIVLDGHKPTDIIKAINKESVGTIVS